MPGGDDRVHGAWHKRLGWFVLLWLLGVLALGASALVLKFVMRLAGLSG